MIRVAARCTAYRCGTPAGEPCPLTAPTPAVGPQPGLDRHCPRCGAEPGRRCVDLAMAPRHRFHTTRTHQARRERR